MTPSTEEDRRAPSRLLGGSRGRSLAVMLGLRGPSSEKKLMKIMLQLQGRRSMSNADDCGKQQVLKINGVGKGSTKCRESCIIPIAVDYKSTHTSVDAFKAYVAEGIGENLPAILWSRSMQAKGSVLL